MAKEFAETAPLALMTPARPTRPGRFFSASAIRTFDMENPPT